MGKERRNVGKRRKKFQAIEFARIFPWRSIYADLKRLIKAQEKRGLFPLATRELEVVTKAPARLILQPAQEPVIPVKSEQERAASL